MAEEDDLQEDEMDALEDAVSFDEETELEEGDDDEGGDLDPLAEEMLKMMEEEEGGEEDQGSGENVDRMMEMEMLKAMEEEGGGMGGTEEAGGMGGMALDGAGAGQAGGGIPASVARLMDVELLVTIELGRTDQTLEEVMQLGEQSLIELDRQVGEPVNVYVNNRLFAKGEVVTVQENFGVRITELVAPNLVGL